MDRYKGEYLTLPSITLSITQSLVAPVGSGTAVGRTQRGNGSGIHAVCVGGWGGDCVYVCVVEGVCGRGTE